MRLCYATRWLPVVLAFAFLAMVVIAREGLIYWIGHPLSFNWPLRTALFEFLERHSDLGKSQKG